MTSKLINFSLCFSFLLADRWYDEMLELDTPKTLKNYDKFITHSAISEM